MPVDRQRALDQVTERAVQAVPGAQVLRDEQLRRALASRDIIGQAKGILMERFAIDAESAPNLLKRLSQADNTPLAEIALLVLTRGR
ncbi:MAG: ANTAR domain-containing protein [Mycobacterium sp.]|nr:ANTAR domain-containing protein [Mycobacterium sp.]